MANMLLKQFEGKTHFEIGEVELKSLVTYNVEDYYKMFFNQEIENIGFKADEDYYVRGFGNIDGQIFVSFYKSYKSEIVRIAYKVVEHQKNLHEIAELIEQEY